MQKLPDGTSFCMSLVNYVVTVLLFVKEELKAKDWIVSEVECLLNKLAHII